VSKAGTKAKSGNKLWRIHSACDLRTNVSAFSTDRRKERDGLTHTVVEGEIASRIALPTARPIGEILEAGADIVVRAVGECRCSDPTVRRSISSLRC